MGNSECFYFKSYAVCTATKVLCTYESFLQLGTQMSLFLFLFACESDPWADCPEELQCLSGDIEINSAKECCAEGEVCHVSDPMEGGTCMNPEDIEE